MIKYIYDKDGIKLLRTVEDHPVCAMDFCDHCGECLFCYGEGPCIDGKEHLWVQYGEKVDENRNRD